MGNRRMGLGRMEVLLEAVDRDLDLTNSTLTAPSISGAAALSLASESLEGGANAGAGTAMSVTTPITFVTTATSKGHVVLADGTSAGQVKIVVLKTRGDTVDMVITPANLGGGTNITANSAGTICVLIWDGSNWAISENTGMVLG